jgi:hypothetical protein
LGWDIDPKTKGKGNDENRKGTLISIAILGRQRRPASLALSSRVLTGAPNFIYREGTEMEVGKKHA